MLKIKNVRVYGLEESIIASGYPMIAAEIDDMDELVVEDNDIKRSIKLGTVPTGTGHDNFLKGITVHFDVTYPNYWTPQFQRYHFADIVSSTSKMHRLTKMNVKECCNEYVDDVVIDNLNEWIDLYNDMVENKMDTFNLNGNSMSKYQVYMKIISNCPMGLEQTMRVTTSYLQLKTIYLQRRHHKLKEDWGNFCDWVETLPKFKEFCLKENK